VSAPSATREIRFLPGAHWAAFIAILWVLFLLSGTTWAREGNSGSRTAPDVQAMKTVTAHRLQDAVKIDGVLDEPDWQGPGTDGFIQNEPDNGAAPVHRTRFWIGYDADAIYLAIRCFDDAPDSIDTAIGRRDSHIDTDKVYLELDTYNDDRTCFEFMVSAGGYILDASEYNDGWEDMSWDGVWDAAARVDDQGWAAEMRIPFSQLRYNTNEDQVWGINITRFIKRDHGREDLFWRERNESGHISRFPDLVGLHGLHADKQREAILYGVGKGEYLQTTNGDPFDDGSKYLYDLGGDLKWSLGSNLTLNATVNPDFGQVEVDPAVVNLSDVETFFDEKRPFFVQDSNTFRFGRNGTNNNWNFNWSDPTLFYSRRVGRTPQLGVTGDADYTDTPAGTTILGAAKLTGKIGETSIGGLTALTSAEYHHLALGPVRSKELAEPLTSYTVLRANRTNADASHALGFMFTATERNLSDQNARESLTRQAYATGIDGWTYLGSDRRWALRGYLSGSLIQGETGAIQAQQLSSRRYYQRPDASYLHYDPNRTRLGGWTSRLMLNKQKGAYTLNTALGAVSPGYEINDLGFQWRSDMINYHLAVGRRWSEPGHIFRNRNVSLGAYSTWDFGGTRNGGGVGLFWNSTFANYWWFNGQLFYNPQFDNTRATRGGPVLRNPTNREFYAELGTDSRRWYQLSTYGSSSWMGDGTRTADGGLNIDLKPMPALQISMGPELSWTYDRSQYVDTREDPASATYGHRYLFSDLHYRELSMSMRVDWSFTPQLTLQTYLQPLIAVGRYTEIKEFTDPGGYGFKTYGEDGGSSIAYDDASDQYTIDPGDGGAPFTLDNPNFNFKSLRLNMVLRWEYLPGSTFYLVWTRNGTNFDHPGQLDLSRDIDALLRAPSDDVVLMKLTRWFDF